MANAWPAAASLVAVAPLILVGLSLLAASRDPGSSRLFYLGGPASSGKETWAKASRAAGLLLAASAAAGLVAGSLRGDPLAAALASYTLAVLSLGVIAARSAAWLELEQLSIPAGRVEPLQGPSAANRAAALAGSLVGIVGLALAYRGLGPAGAALLPMVAASLLITAELLWAPHLLYRPWLGEHRSYILASMAALLCGASSLLTGLVAVLG